MARYLTRMEVGAKVHMRDIRGHLPGEYFWENVSSETQDEIRGILSAVGWPNPPSPTDRRIKKQRGRTSSRPVRLGHQPRRRSQSSPSRGRNGRPGGSRAAGARGVAGGGRSESRDAREGPGGGPAEQVGMKRLASEMRLLMRLR